MKTTLDLPDELMRTIKVRAAQEDRRLKDLIAELLRKGLAAEPGREPEGQPAIRRRVKLPLVQSVHPAAPGEEMTPERIHQILLDQEVSWYAGRTPPPDDPVSL